MKLEVFDTMYVRIYIQYYTPLLMEKRETNAKLRGRNLLEKQK